MILIVSFLWSTLLTTPRKVSGLGEGRRPMVSAAPEPFAGPIESSAAAGGRLATAMIAAKVAINDD